MEHVGGMLRVHHDQVNAVGLLRKKYKHAASDTVLGRPGVPYQAESKTRLYAFTLPMPVAISHPGVAGNAGW